MDWFIVTREGDAQCWHDTDGVLIDARQHLLWGHDEAVAFQGDLAMLDIPVPGELVPTDLYWASDEVGAIRRLSFSATPSPPLPQERHSAQHRGFARARRR